MKNQSNPSKRIVVVDYKMGNLKSVVNALSFLGESALISDDPKVILDSHAIVLPGVGAFGAAMKNLQDQKLIDVLNKKVMVEKVPFLGICLGMQLIADESEELGKHKGLGWVSGRVEKLKQIQDLRVPHVGWNQVDVIKSKPFFDNINTHSDFYFVHSYHFVANPSDVAATCYYGEPVTAAVQKNNIFAVQFHPEKSQHCGLRILRNFTKVVAQGDLGGPC